jgi:type II secretory ATPase GspE/PulE/Tfp pilus assembly ATPase PilB-like protein
VGFFSVLRADERTSRLILAGADERAWAEALAPGVRQDLRGAALDKVCRGVTSLEEAARVLGLR